MTSSHSSTNIWHWLQILGGVALLILTINQACLSLAAGLLQFSSHRYGFTFFGIEAAAIYVALTLGASLIIGLGWRGLRHGRGGT